MLCPRGHALSKHIFFAAAAKRCKKIFNDVRFIASSGSTVMSVSIIHIYQRKSNTANRKKKSSAAPQEEGFYYYDYKSESPHPGLLKADLRIDFLYILAHTGWDVLTRDIM